MSPILGILASSFQGAVGDYESISTVTVGAGGSSSITFSSIPSTYKHLQIRGIVRSTTSGTDSDSVYGSFNGDTTNTNYFTHALAGNGSVTYAYGVNSINGFSVGSCGKAGTTANAFGVSVVDILDYANTNKYKTVRVLQGNDRNGLGDVFLQSGLWMNTNAVTSITIVMASNNLAQYSSFALYGIK